MQPGPFDQRLKRRRCRSCAVRHVKCSMTSPCANCSTKDLPCEYPQHERRAIALGRHRTAKAWTAAQLPWSISESEDDESRFFTQFFTVFVPKNQFSGNAHHWHAYLSQSLSRCQGHFHTLAGLGAYALYSSDRRKYRHTGLLERAIRYSQNGLRFLSAQISDIQSVRDPLSIASVAFLLSLFELMFDATGVAWNAHMGFGMSALLTHFGPLAFRSADGLSIYREIRLFEISRAILFSEPTLLADANWYLHDTICRNTVDDWNVVEMSFDLMLQCAAYGQRMIEHASALKISDDKSSATGSSRLYDMGSQLQGRFSLLTTMLTTGPTSKETNLAWLYVHALSIYMSGLFDHVFADRHIKEAVWHLDSEQIQYHAERILELGKEALEEGYTSQLLLLVPLRIAGGRCTMPRQCEKVRKLLNAIEINFAVAKAFTSELVEIWSLHSSA